MTEFPAILLAATPVAIKFVIDGLIAIRPNLAPWAKVLGSYAVSLAFVVGYGFVALAAAGGMGPVVLDYALTALLLAAVTSKVVHPLVEATRAIARITDEPIV